MTPNTLDTIRRDIAAFADPATEVSVHERGAEWTQRRVRHQVSFSPGADRFPDIQYRGRSFSYRDFFASEHMADLRAFAEATCTQIFPPNIYIEGKAAYEESSSHQSACGLLRSLAATDKPRPKTQLIFLRGNAGGGKTALLTHLAATQASDFLKGKCTHLFFYIDAQGRALSRLDEAVALILQDLRTSFTYHAVSTLTRLGLIVPIIDGFDELLGVGGYQEAFSSLGRFLSRLEGEGTIIASARSSFYHYSAFGQVASRLGTSSGFTLDYVILPVDILPWGEEEIGEYLDKAGTFELLGATDRVSAVSALRKQLGDSGSELMSSPFFLAAVAELIRDGMSIRLGAQVSRSLVEQFVKREVDKLKDRNGAPILGIEQHMTLLEMLAEEMWWQETRGLDAETVRVRAELACEEFKLTPENGRVLVERITSNGLLGLQGQPALLAFRHEYYYAHFLGNYISRSIKNKNSVSELLSRSTLSSVVAKEMALATDATQDALRETVETISGRRLPPMAREVSRTNAGSLFAALIREHGNKMRSVSFVEGFIDGGDLRNSSLQDCSFRNCEFSRVDLRGVAWKNIHLAETRLLLPRIDKSACLGISGLALPSDVSGVVFCEGDSKQEEVYAPVRIINIMSAAGVVVPPDIAASGAPLSKRAIRHIEFLSRFLRMASRTYYFSEEDLENRGLHNLPEGEVVTKLMRKHKLIESTKVPRRGTSSEVMKLTVPATQIEVGETGSDNQFVSDFWQELQSL